MQIEEALGVLISPLTSDSAAFSAGLLPYFAVPARR